MKTLYVKYYIWSTINQCNKTQRLFKKHGLLSQVEVKTIHGFALKEMMGIHKNLKTNSIS